MAVSYNYGIKEAWLTVVLSLLFFQTILIGWIGNIFSYSDEFAALMGMYVLIIKKMTYITIEQKKDIISWRNCLFGIVLIGVVSSLLSRLQPFGIIWFNDIFTFIKIFLVFVYCLDLSNRCDVKGVIKVFGKVLAVYLFLSIVFCIINQLVEVPFLYDEGQVRFGIKDYRFFHMDAGDYSTILICAIAFIHVSFAYKNKGNGLLVLFAIICLLATTRGKSFGVLAAYLGLLFFFGKKGRLTLRKVIIILALGVSFGFFQIETYFSDDSTPRAAFYVFGALTANNYFPLGAGFGSFGSNMAKTYYSPLYEEYGFSSRHGMGEDTTEANFLNDNFWPMVMGQYGWFGVLLYLLIVYIIFRIIFSINNRHLQIAGMILFITLIFSSTAGPVFVDYHGGTIVATLAFILISYNKLSTR